MYTVVSEDVQVAILDWEQDDPASFFKSFKILLENEGNEPYDAYDLVELALDLYSLKYAVLESSTFDLKFIRILIPEHLVSNHQ